MNPDHDNGIPRCPNPLKQPLRSIGWLARTILGLVSVLLLLAIVAAVPVVNFLALGYLLEVEGRVARTGRLGMAFPLAEPARRLAGVAIGIWIWLFPLRLLSGAAADARLIDPQSSAATTLDSITLAAACFVGLHLCLVLARGGGFWSFFRPIKNARWMFRTLTTGYDWEAAERSLCSFCGSFRLGHHFWLGLRGFAGAMIWLALPTALFAAADRAEGGPVLVTILGGVLLVAVFSWVPFLQARFAAENRFRAMFEWRTVRQLFGKAPIAWLLAIVVVFSLALPLYLFKVAAPARDAMWFLTIVFIASIYPAKIVTGWAYHRALAREHPSWFGFRWLSRAVMLPLLGLYVFLLFFTQLIGEHGKRVLFEHHAFLLPSPF